MYNIYALGNSRKIILQKAILGIIFFGIPRFELELLLTLLTLLKFLPPEMFGTNGMSDVTFSILTFILRLLYTIRGVTRPSDAARPSRTLTFSGR